NYYWRGRIYRNIQDYPAALIDFSKAIELQPEVGYNYHWRGHVYLNTQNYITALADFSKAIELQPKNDINYFWRALTHLFLLNDQSGLVDLEYSIKLQPNHISLLFWQGVILHLLQRAEEAQKVWQQTNELLNQEEDTDTQLRVVARLALIAKQVEETYQRD